MLSCPKYGVPDRLVEPLIEDGRVRLLFIGGRGEEERGSWMESGRQVGKDGRNRGKRRAERSREIFDI